MSSRKVASLAAWRSIYVLANSPDSADTMPAIVGIVARDTPHRLLRDLLDEMMHAGGRSFGDVVDTALATMACHAAIRAGDAL